MKVYRLESYGGDGVFSMGCAGPKLARKIPGPEKDGIFEFRGFHFGFTPEQFFDIVNEDDIRDMCISTIYYNMNNVGVSEYDVEDSDIKIGRHQIAFNKLSADRKCWIPVSEFIS